MAAVLFYVLMMDDLLLFINGILFPFQTFMLMVQMYDESQTI